MIMNKALIGVCLAVLLSLGGCSRQQSDWEKTRAANTTDAYEQFLKKYPSGEFAARIFSDELLIGIGGVRRPGLFPVALLAAAGRDAEQQCKTETNDRFIHEHFLTVS